MAVATTVPRKTGERIAEGIAADLDPLVEFSLAVGSIRRGRPRVKDVELVVLPRDLSDFLGFVRCLGFRGNERIARTEIDGVPVELYIAHRPEELGAMVWTYTGDKVFNIAMRSIAKRRGLKLDQYGVRDAGTGEIVFQSPREEDFFEFLGVRYHAPEERSFKERGKGAS